MPRPSARPGPSAQPRSHGQPRSHARPRPGARPRSPDEPRSTEQYRVRLSAPGDLAGALPQLLGFQPQESVVLISLDGPRRRRVGLTLRADLCGPEHAGTLSAGIVRSILTGRPDAVVVLIVTEAGDVVLDPAVDPTWIPAAEPAREPTAGTGLPQTLLVSLVRARLADAGVPVHDEILVRAGRWWSYLRPGPGGIPGPGTRLPAGTSELAAASVLLGQVVEVDRAALERRVAPVGFLAAAGMAGACADVGLATRHRRAEVGADVLAAESWELLEAVASGRGAGSRGWSDAATARLAWALRDTRVRDRALGLALGPGPELVEELWAELTRRAPGPLAAAPATLLAVSAWLRGDGALANIALDRALSSDPSYGLALLLTDALAAAMPPADIRRIISATADPLGPSR